MFTYLHAMAAIVTGKLDIKSEKGATAVEYGIMVAAIAMKVFTGVISWLAPTLAPDTRARALPLTSQTQNQTLTPVTRLNPPVLSPSARAKRAVSPTFRSQDTPR